jgi:hypothetical protein
MGAFAGTGVRSFAEGGSTSTPTSAPTGEASAAPPRQIYQPQYEDYGLSSTPQAQGRLASILNMGNYGNQMPTFTRPQAPPRQIYQPQYEDYGLSSTPQAQGRLASILNMGNYGNQMPTFTRPQAPPPQAQYSIPYRTTPDSSFSGVLNRVTPLFGGSRSSPEQRATNLNKAIQNNELTYDQYEQMMAKPDLYLPYVQSVQSGNAPTTIGYQQQPIRYMTTAQQKAYNNKIKSELDALLRPITIFPQQDSGGGG